MFIRQLEFVNRISKTNETLLRQQIFTAFAEAIRQNGQESDDSAYTLDVSDYVLPMPLTAIKYTVDKNIEFVGDRVTYNFGYFNDTKDLANLYDCLAADITDKESQEIMGLFDDVVDKSNQRYNGHV